MFAFHNGPDASNLTEGTDFYHSNGPHDIPHNAIKSGLSPCGEVYVGGVKHANMTMPCKIIPKDNCSYFPYFGKELQQHHFTYLVTKPGYTYEWVPSSGGVTIPSAARLGKGSNGEPFLVGRVTMNEERCVSKVLPSHGICYVPKSGKEHQFKFFDVLVIKPSSLPVPGLTAGTSLYYSSGPNDIPTNAIPSGLSPCGQIYVGYVQHGNETMPAKIIPKDRLAYYPHGGREHSTAKFTFLVINAGYTHEWVPSANGGVPPGAAKLGSVSSGENFYVGRVTIDDERCVAKILASHGVCYVPKSGQEHSKRFYDALVIKKK